MALRLERDKSSNDDVTDAVLSQLLIEVSVREPALSPVLISDYIAVLRSAEAFRLFT
jgi:hypothetical protein